MPTDNKDNNERETNNETTLRFQSHNEIITLNDDEEFSIEPFGNFGIKLRIFRREIPSIRPRYYTYVSRIWVRKNNNNETIIYAHVDE